MFGIFIIALIIYAVVQHRKRSRLRWMKRGGGDWSKWKGDCSKWSTDWSKWTDEAQKTASHAEQFANDLHSKIKRDFETRMSRKFEAKSARYDRRMRARFNRQTQKYGGVSLDPENDLPPPPEFKNDAERQAYERARKRAAAEAGFFVHLMWYGIIIGFLFVINLLTGGFGSYPWFIWPALGWGFGIASHFAAVYGWRWVHQRVFEPAIAREVNREVLQEKEQLRTEKQASLDELTATFAHEINTRRSRSTNSRASSAACRICSSTPRKKTTSLKT